MTLFCKKTRADKRRFDRDKRRLDRGMRFENTPGGSPLSPVGVSVGGEDALRAALGDWQYALGVFDAAEDPKLLELASIRLEAAHRRYGCLASDVKR